MQLARRTLTEIAEMICADSSESGIGYHNFPYRTGSELTEFFANCDMDFVHDGSTRRQWVVDMLERLNTGPASNSQLPSDGLVRVVQELMDLANFRKKSLDRDAALEDLNTVLGRDNLQAYFDGSSRCHLRNIDTQATSAAMQFQRRTWTSEELARREEVSDFLGSASEDEFIEKILVPLFSQLGFVRISVAGHRDKSLEFGKDLWMKYQLPTSHYIYFGVQAKKNRLDAAGKSGEQNVAEVLTQVRMMLNSPVWDPETNNNNLLDHVFIACAGDITKQAKSWLGQHLDQENRRHVLFLDRNDILDLVIGINLPLLKAPEAQQSPDDEIPF